MGPRFQVLNRLFVFSFKDGDDRESHKQYYLPTVEIKDYNIMIDGRNFFDQTMKNDLKTYDNIKRIATGLGCLLDYPFFKNYYKLIAIDLSKQPKLDVDQKEIQQINFTGNLYKAESSTMFFIIEEPKEKVLDLSKGTGKAL